MQRHLTMKRFAIYSSFAVLIAVHAASAQERGADVLPPGAKVVKFEVAPTTIELKTPFEYRQLLVTGILDSGERVDVTRAVKYTPPAAVKVSERGQVRPVKDGSGALKLVFQNLTADIPVKISGQDKPVEVSFTRDVMPVIGRMGCNAGTCHGAQQGRAGFQLSLRGYDPEFDHRALVDDTGGRRLHRAAP